MLTNKKYKSDKILKPLVVILGIIALVAYYTSHKAVAMVSIIAMFTCLLGTTAYRCVKERNTKDAIYSIIGLLIFYAVIIAGIKFLNVKL